jgi:ABC-2 type transport system ATP-binding protein
MEVKMDRTIAINVSRLCKTYDNHKAVDDLSFQIYAGEIFGLLGPNGAGKSTTLRTLITLLHPTSGTATVMGYDTVREADRVRTVIGYVPQERAIDRFLTGREHLQLLGALYHLTKEEAAKRIGELLKLVDLEAHADRPAKTYSGGMKRKLDIACGLLPDPKILFLDEPTLGLDVQSRLRIWEYVRMLKARGMTVVMTTNYLDEADQLCDRLAIIDGGTIKTLGSPAELKIALGGDIVSLTLKETSRIQSLESDLTGRPAIKTVRATTKGLDIRVETPEKALPTILESANRLGCEVEFIQYNRPRLDDVFIAHTGRAITETIPEGESE